MESIFLFFTFLPLFVIMGMANQAQLGREQGRSYRTLAVLSYVLLILFYGMTLMAGTLIHLGSAMLVEQPELLQELGLELDNIDLSSQFESLPLLGMGLWLPSLVGIILLLPPLRHLFAKFIPIDAASPVHAIALSFTMIVVINLMLTLGVGLGNLTTQLQEQATANGPNNMMATLWVQQILTAILAMVGVGWLSRRNLGQTFARLKMTLPTNQQVGWGVGIGLAMVPVVILMEYVSSLFGFGADPDVEALTEQLLGPLFNSPFGILTLGLAAALGEETLFRGAVQPRFGLFLTALLFAVLHSNYGLTVSTLIVFVLGLVLGWVRIRHNTSTAMIIHAVYNMTLGLLAYLGSSLLDV